MVKLRGHGLLHPKAVACICIYSAEPESILSSIVCLIISAIKCMIISLVIYVIISLNVCVIISVIISEVFLEGFQLCCYCQLIFNCHLSHTHDTSTGIQRVFLSWV